jgi:uncharacterized coiled-coil protein SlyX
MSDAAHIEDLQIRMAHLEYSLQQISDEVVRQQQQIDALTQRGHHLLERLAALQGEGDADAATRIEVPPHY